MAVDCYLQLDNIKGESQVASFKNWIEVETLLWSGANKASTAYGTGSGSGKVSLADFSITKRVDTASVPLFLNLCSGTHIAKGTIAVNKATGGTAATATFMKFEMTELFVTSVNLAIATEFPTEIVTLSYKTLKYTYFSQGADGNLTASGVAGWDLSRNAKM